MKQYATIDWEAIRRRLRTCEEALRDAASPSRDSMRKLLEARATRLAEARCTAAAGQELLVLVFRLGSDRFAFEVADVAKVSRLGRCTPIPGAAASVRGLICRHGDVHSVFDLARLLGRQPSEWNAGLFVIHVRASGGELSLCVDELEQIRSVCAVDLMAPSGNLSTSSPVRTRGIHHDGLTILQVAAPASSPALGTDTKG